MIAENRSSFVQFDLRFEAQKVSQIAMSKSFIHVDEVDEVEDRLEKVTFANIEEVISKLEDHGLVFVIIQAVLQPSN